MSSAFCASHKNIVALRRFCVAAAILVGRRGAVSDATIADRLAVRLAAACETDKT
jgi:hypothetical protein